MKIALVHDFLNQYGGAERVLEVFSEMFPEAPIYTLLYDRQKMHGKFSDRKIYTSFLQKIPFLRKRPRYLLPLLPTAPETFDLREYDLVISSSGAWSKGIVTRLNTIHIAYIHSPMRFVWDYNEKYLKEEKKRKVGFLVRPILSYFRLWDKLAADRPEYLIANSRYTQARIKKYYRRDSEVIYPPAFVIASEAPACRRGGNQSRDDNKKYFLIVSRLSAYKKIDAAVKAFNKLGLPLIIIGEGKQNRYLKRIARKNIKFLGFQPDEKLGRIYSEARALIFPGVDDFGLAPAEAMSHGVPVIGLGKGGLLEIVEEGKTGEFFQNPTSENIAETVKKFISKEKKYNREYVSQSAKRFGKERFKGAINGFIKRILL